MKTALLCNGPSRLVFNPDLVYNYTIGCNIPWSVVNSTMIMDVNVLQKFTNPCDFYISKKAWIECPNKIKEKLNRYLLGIIDPLPEYDSAGHAAARMLITLGATSIDIYGCDSWWENNTESHTHQYVDGRSADMSKHVSVWRQRWYELMGKYPQVNFNFIRESK